MSAATKSERPHVLIVGAGIGGLTLAQALRKQGVSFEIFERDEALHSRFAGWSISLHVILADLKTDMPDDLPPIEMTNHLLPLDRPAGLSIYSEDGQRTDIGYGQFPFLRANRPRLRDYLATNVNINWGKHLTGIEEDDASVTVQFSDGTSATGDILVGADGINSVVRKHVFHGKDELNTLPLTQVVGNAVLDREQLERQFNLGTSAYILRKRDYYFFVGVRHVSDDASHAELYWLWAQLNTDSAHGSLWPVKASKQEQYDFVMSCASDLDPKFKEILLLSKPEDIHTPALILRDMVVEDMPNSRITLLGDAIHPMTPYRGEGGNQAMKDGINLARLLAGTQAAAVTDTLKTYQAEMLSRGADAVKRSRQALYDYAAGAP